MAWLKNLQNIWHGVVHSADQDAIVFAHALINLMQSSGGKVLRDAAVAAVTAAETTGGTGEIKLAAATASVIATLTTEGIPVVKTAVNGAIEAAVASMNTPAVS